MQVFILTQRKKPRCTLWQIADPLGQKYKGTHHNIFLFKRKYNSYVKGTNLNRQFASSSCSQFNNVNVSVWRFKYWHTYMYTDIVSTFLGTPQCNSQVTLALSEASDNQWTCTMTPMEDYKNSLSLCRSAYCIDFVILVIGLYFCAAEYCYNFLFMFPSFSLSSAQLFSGGPC